MYLKISPAAQKRIKTVMKDHQQILMDFDDGVGPFSAIGNCSLDDSFRLILVNDQLKFKDFNASFDSDLGRIYYKDYTKPYFDEQMTLSFNDHLFTMPLKSAFGILTDNVELVDGDQALANQEQLHTTHDC